MEFWGAEVKNGEPFKVQPGEGMVLHLSQASLGELKKDKGSETVCLTINVDGKKLVLGTLNSDKLPQQQFDLVFDRDFEISHNWKNGSVYFFGYRASNPFDEEDDEDDEDESDDEIPFAIANNGLPEPKAKEAEKSNAAKEAASGKQKVTIVEPIKDAKSDDEDESTDEDDMSDDDEDDDMAEGEEDDSDEDDSDDSEDETPKKAETGKKRKPDSAAKTPVTDKKAKLATPQKTDGKKGSGHVATPHPAKQAGKNPANKNQQTPKSGGSHVCQTCKRTFGSETALGSHSKAKHSAGK